MLFEPVRKTQDAMFFFKNPEGMWIPCGPKQQDAVQISMQDLAANGLASKVWMMPTDFDYNRSGSVCLGNDNWRSRVVKLRFCISIVCYVHISFK